MEMLHGGTVDDLLRSRRKPLPPAEALDIAVRVSGPWNLRTGWG